MNLSPNKRIVLNVAVTYFRTGYALVCGLLTARWLLLSLGRTDYGLLGVVGALLAFVTFFNRSMSSAVQRFFAVSIGKSKRRFYQSEGLEECRKWFTVAVVVHTLVPLALCAVGYPLGEYAVCHWLNIPHERVSACVWVWRLTCISALAGMMNAPFRAMYRAHQEIGELTFYSMLKTTLNVILLYYMVTHPADWLVGYVFWHCLIGVVPKIVMGIRSFVRFPQCKIIWGQLWNWSYMRKMLSFVGWSVFLMAGRLSRNQGLAILVNRYLGPDANAAWSIANRLSGRSNRFSASTVEAFSPAIMTAKGSGNDDRALKLALRVSKFGALVVGVVSLPLGLEVTEVMRLWLKDFPPESPLLCICVAGVLFMQKISSGLYISISTSGKIAYSSIAVGLCFMLTLPLAAILMIYGQGLKSVGISLLVTTFLAVFVRLYYARKYGNIPSLLWFRSVFIPVVVILGVSAVTGWLPRMFFDASIWRIALTIFCSDFVLAVLAWIVVLTNDEKQYVVEKIRRVLRKLATRRSSPNE